MVIVVSSVGVHVLWSCSGHLVHILEFVVLRFSAPLSIEFLLFGFRINSQRLSHTSPVLQLGPVCLPTLQNKTGFFQIMTHAIDIKHLVSNG